MPLQIRRGTQAERENLVEGYIPLASGEPLFTTDTGNFYIGDGSTAGGIHVNAPQDISAGLPTYVGQIGQFERDPLLQPGVKTPFLTFNGISVTIDLNGQISTDITPRLNEVNNLGNENFRFRKAWVGGEGIAIGEATITATLGPFIELPAGSLVAGSQIVTQDSLPLIFVEGESYNIGIKADDDTLMVNTTTKEVNASFNGPLFGSVFGADSTAIVDSENSEITANVFNLSNGSSINGEQLGEIGMGSVSSPVKLVIYNNSLLDVGLDVRGITNGEDQPVIRISSSRGTLEAPALIQNGDALGGILFTGYNAAPTGTPFVPGAVISAFVDDSSISPGDSSFESTIVIGSISDIISDNILKIRPGGIVDAPIIKTKSYETVNLPDNPEPGWMVFDSTTNEFKGWNGTSWVVLG